MIPTFEDVEAAHRFLARRHGVSGQLHEQGVRGALELARSLAASPRDEPAAVFYALSRYPRALGGLARALPVMIALNLARATGHPIHATAAELRAFFVPLAARELSYEDVRGWFNDRAREPG